MNDDFTITIEPPFESVDYRDHDGLFSFNLSQGETGGLLLHVYECLGEALLPRTFTDEQRERIIPRIITEFQRGGDRVAILSSKPPPPPHPLRSVDEILQERLWTREFNEGVTFISDVPLPKDLNA